MYRFSIPRGAFVSSTKQMHKKMLIELAERARTNTQHIYRISQSVFIIWPNIIGKDQTRTEIEREEMFPKFVTRV